MRGFNLLAATVFCGMFMPNLMGQSGTPQALSGDQVVERVSPSAVSILVGKGDGQLAGVGSGVVVRSDGVILTANHVVKGMREVQVRLKSGEIFDQVELIPPMNGATLRHSASRPLGFQCFPLATPLTRHPAPRSLSYQTLSAYPGRHPQAS